jgi:DNA-binding MarR family transcriptional regulator
VSGDREVSIALTDAQVARVLREASGRARLASLLPEMGVLDVVFEIVLPLLEDEAYSRSVLRVLLVINALPVDGGERALTDIARELGLSPGTAHRYLHTLTAVGLLEQNPRSRRYRRMLSGDAIRERAEATGGGDAG